MQEQISFSDLTLSNPIFLVTDKDYFVLLIKRIEDDEDERGKTKIAFHWEADAISLPGNEYNYIDKETGFKYTTSKKQYKEWIIPFVEKKIKEKEKRIADIQLEIQELKESINTKS